MKTVELLDNYTEFKIRNKWVAGKRGVSKCLVVKWNRNRDKNLIFPELQLNKKKHNTGSMKVGRQRRKLVGEKAKCSEKYPLAANRVVLKFKLQREKGCKVSKLWIKKKMKAKIETYYGGCF